MRHFYDKAGEDLSIDDDIQLGLIEIALPKRMNPVPRPTD